MGGAAAVVSGGPAAATTRASAPDWVAELFRVIDARDAEAFAAHIAEDGSFAFANLPPVRGRAAIREAVAGFFASIAALSHRIEECWDTGDAVITRGSVSYTRHDGSTLTVPFADVFRMRGGKIGDYLIFLDASRL